jgi:hypothetical protein
MKAQAVVDQVADRIDVASQGGTATSGIAGVVVDPARRTVKLYWHGDPTAAVSREISAAGALGVSVTVTQAPYTRNQLLDETKRLAGLNAAQPASAGARVVSVAPMPDGSGLDVGMSGVPANVSAEQARQHVPYLSSTALSLTVTGNVSPVPGSRQADTPPYWGGALITQGSGACSSGFGVAGNNGAATYILTAAHCGPGTWSTGAGVAMGSTIQGVDWTHDAELILTNAGNLVYDGGSIAGGTQFSKYVVGASPSRVGDWVCTSGAFSGAVCNIQVVKTDEAISVGGHPMTLVRAEQSNHVAPIGNGDSGGPVFSLANSNVDDVARGTITAYDTATIVPCQGVPSGNGRSCGWRMWFPDITYQANSLFFHVNVR